MYALDTNTLICFFKGLGNVHSKFLSKEPKSIYIPSIVIYELEVGIKKSTHSRTKHAQLQNLMEACHVIPFGVAESRVSAEIRIELERKGSLIGTMDLLIAGTAMANNLTLVTHNTREFQQVKTLRLEDWY